MLHSEYRRHVKRSVDHTGVTCIEFYNIVECLHVDSVDELLRVARSGGAACVISSRDSRPAAHDVTYSRPAGRQGDERENK